MKMTTLCYIERGGKYLMLHRTAKQGDENYGKWIGIGGKFKDGESPEDCVRREVMEETGLTLCDLRFRGIITFVSDDWGTEYMHLFSSDKFLGTVIDCDEGVLEWIDKHELISLTLWEGDKIFLRLLDERENFFSLKLRYRGEKLTEAFLDGEKIEI